MAVDASQATQINWMIPKIKRRSISSKNWGWKPVNVFEKPVIVNDKIVAITEKMNGTIEVYPKYPIVKPAFISPANNTFASQDEINPVKKRPSSAKNKAENKPTAPKINKSVEIPVSWTIETLDEKIKLKSVPRTEKVAARINPSAIVVVFFRALKVFFGLNNTCPNAVKFIPISLT